MNKKLWTLLLAVVNSGLLTINFCKKPLLLKDRAETIPPGAVKMRPELDSFPPILFSNEWEPPVPMPGPVNTAGAEDSPFITPDGSEFYFFFTPDVSVPAEKQIVDGVTGMWYCRLENGLWTEPERVVLNNDISLDGAQFVMGDTMWFASVRAGNYGEIDWYLATRRNGKWGNWRNAGRQINEELKPGELHISADHRTMYYGKTEVHGGLDICRSERTSSGWTEPVNLGPLVNSARDESQPFLSSDGSELWFTGWNDSLVGPCVYRCRKDTAGQWQRAEIIVGQFAGEPTLDDEGNLYFVHHFYSGGESSHMIEADIYLCRRKSTLAKIIK
ncbi:hypothetical protein HPY86_04400 [candidate division WOR-3 bacterium]|nr:hypothetical protein [candidate division WOR-3 bacterium]